MFEMPCGRSFERDDQVLLHAETCEVCASALNESIGVDE